MEADVLIIGGGAAGTVAALLLAKAGKHCIILEKNGQIGRKLRITGKGRCNLTNACDLDTLMANVIFHHKFQSCVAVMNIHRLLQIFRQCLLQICTVRYFFYAFTYPCTHT